jgi:hypothetical protein
MWLIGFVFIAASAYAMRRRLQGLFYALRSFFSRVGFGHDLERMPCTWSHTTCRHSRMSGDDRAFVDSPQRPARLAEGHLPCRHRRRNEEAQQIASRNRCQPGSYSEKAEVVGRLSSVSALRCSALHAQGNKLLLYRRSNSGTTALYIPGTTPHPNGFPRRKVGRTVCIPTSSSPPIRWRRLRQHRSTTKPNKSSQASPGRVELVQSSSFLGADWAACSVVFSA